jgi:hypothetical protein
MYDSGVASIIKVSSALVLRQQWALQLPTHNIADMSALLDSRHEIFHNNSKHNILLPRLQASSTVGTGNGQPKPPVQRRACVRGPLR